MPDADYYIFVTIGNRLLQECNGSRRQPARNWPGRQTWFGKIMVTVVPAPTLLSILAEP